MEPIKNYRQFNITHCEHGGFHYAPIWSDGSEVALHANTISEAHELIDAYWTEHENEE